jgi:hypothetical protein
LATRCALTSITVRSKLSTRTPLLAGAVSAVATTYASGSLSFVCAQAASNKARGATASAA